MIIQSSTVTRLHWFTAAVTGTPTAQIYVNGVATGAAINGTGSGDAWTFAVPVGALTIGASAEIWVSGVVGGITEWRLLAGGQVVELSETVDVDLTGVATEAKQNQLLGFFHGINKLVEWLRK